MQVSNPRYATQFFGNELAREAVPFAIALKKPENTCRIFLIGGSAAMGIPDPTFGMAHALEVMLRHRYPGVDFEIINAAITATNSHVMLPVAEECSSMDADLLVVYLGNNEVVGPYGAGTVFNPLTANRGVIRIAMAARSLRTIQMVASLSEKKQNWSEWKGMEMFLEKQVRQGDAPLATTYSHFEANLREICSAALNKNARVILSTVGVNLKNCAPFASLHAKSLSEEALEHWHQAYRLGTEHSADKKWAEAISAYETAARIDNTYAELHYRLGRCQEAIGRHAEALTSYSLARDLDTLRFRADTRINNIIRQVAKDSASHGVVLADAEARLADAAAHNIPGSESFFEHVHLRFEGNVTVARALADAAEKALPDWVLKHKSSADPLSAEQCAQRMAYTPLARYEDLGNIVQMMSNPPFTNQYEHDIALTALKDKQQSLAEWTCGDKVKQALATLRQATTSEKARPQLRNYFAAVLLKYGGDAREAESVIDGLANVLPPTDDIMASTHIKALLKLGRQDEAQSRFKQAVDARPWDDGLRAEIGHAYLDSGDAKTAREIFEEIIQRNPGNAKAHNNLGSALSRLGKLDESLKQYQKALNLRPDFAEVHHNIGLCLQGLQRPKQALTHYQQALQHKPDFAEAHYDLGVALQRLGNAREAVIHYQKTIRIRPDFIDAYLNLGNTLQTLKCYDEAAESYQQGLQVNPDHAELHNNLGVALLTLGRTDEAASHYIKALKIDPKHIRAHYNLGNALLKQARTTEAIPHLQYAAKSTPNSSTVRMKLAAALLQTQQYQKAIPHLEQLLRLKPDHPWVHDQLGFCLLQLGRLENAETHISEAIRLKPDYHDARCHLGRIRQLQRRNKEALSLYESTLKSNPGHLMTLNDLARLLATSPEASIRNGQRAVQLAEQATRLTGHKNPLLLDSLAAAHAETGNFEQAVRWQSKALELAPEPMKPSLRQRLELYTSNKPFHTPLPNAPNTK